MSDIGGTSPAASAASFGAFQAQSPFEQSATSAALQSANAIADPTRLLPAGLRDAFSVGDNSTSPVVKSLPSSLRALNNKYTKMADELNALPSQVRESLISLDSQRVSTGGKPLTEDETRKVIQTYVEKKPATPEAERKPFDIVGNTLGDLGAILKSIPRIPQGIVEEIKSLGDMGEGSNPLSQLANAPGVRMLPGAYIVGNLAEGNVGELARHPLFTALDVLPALGKAAEFSKVGEAAAQASKAAGTHPRPLAAFLTQKLDGDGAIIDRAPRAVLKDLRDSTRPGQLIDEVLGGRARQVAREFEQARMQVVSLMNGVDQANGDQVVLATQRATKLNTKYKDEFGWDQNRVAEVTTKMKMGSLDAFTPDELAYRNEFNELADTFGNELVREDLIGKFDGEFYTKEQAKELHGEARRAAHFRAATALRDEWRSSGKRFAKEDLDEFVTDALGRKDDTAVGVSRYQVNEFRVLANLMDRYGYDVTEARSLAGKLGRKGSTTTAADVADSFRRVIDSTDEATLRPRASAADVVELLNKRAPKDIQVRFLTNAVARGDSAEITLRLKNILNRKQLRSELFDETTIADIRALRDQYAADKFAKTYTRKRADQAAVRYNTLRSNTVPARWGDVIGERTRQGATVDVVDVTKPGAMYRKEITGANTVLLDQEAKALGRALTEDEVGALTLAVVERRWGQFTFGEFDTVADIYRGIEDEVKKSWRSLRREGLDPSFIHVTSNSRVHSTLHPKPGPVPVGLTQTQERLVDMAPGVNDAGVALSHQGMEILSRRASEEALDRVLGMYGVTERTLREQYALPAREAASTDPLWGFEGELRNFIEKRYTAVNLKDLGFDWKSARLDKFAQDRVFIPRALHDVLGQISRPKQLLGGLFDPITKLFRISVVGLSPRTHLYNILGGATMLMGQTGPGAFQYWKQAREWAKNPELITSETLRHTLGSQRAIMRDFDDILDASTRVRKAHAIANVSGGRTMGRLWGQIQESKLARGTGKLIEKSLDLNAFFDDTYRAMAYMHGYDKGLAKGLTKDAAERAGMELTQKVMMDWGSLTPIERSVLKSVFPFYSFMNHSIRYVSRYPVDHPLRAGLLGAFGRAQQEDLDGLFPDSFLSYFTFGAMGDDGKQNALSLGPINPFGDVANTLTFAGFLSATNPAIATVLESVGLDRGQAELYPSLRYNPETGRLEGVRSNPLVNFVQNTIPQSQILMTLFGVHTDLSQRIERDPASAIRTLWSAGGMPILWRNLNVPQETFKAELSRQDSQESTLSAALKSGNWQNANRYPGLDGVRENVAGLPAEVLAAYTPPEQQAIRAQLEALLAGQGSGVPVGQDAMDLLDQALQPNAVAQTVRIGGM